MAIEYLLKHIVTKFHGHWIFTLGVMDFIFKSSESARNVTKTRIMRSHYDWKALKLEICLQLVESHKFGFELGKKHGMKRYKVIWLKCIFGIYLVLKLKIKTKLKMKMSFKS